MEGLNNSRQAKAEGICFPQTTSTGYFRGTALDGSTPKKSTEQNTQHMKNGGGGIRRVRNKHQTVFIIAQ